MTKASRECYFARMQQVLDHIDRHPDGDLGLDALSRVAAFSPYHFHRQFSALFGISAHRYVQLSRMKRASCQLAFRTERTATDIALDAGYESPEAFARAFRQRFGQLPSTFRKSPDWETWSTALEPLNHARNMLMTAIFSASHVSIVDVPATPVAVLEHHGDPAAIGESIRRFIAWRKANGLSPKVSATYNVFHSNPRTTPPSDYRLDLCAATDRTIAGNVEGVKPGVIPAGRCAVLRVTGSSDDLESAALFLYRDWLPASGEEARDFPLYCHRVSFFPDVPEHQAVTDLHLPLR